MPACWRAFAEGRSFDPFRTPAAVAVRRVGVSTSSPAMSHHEPAGKNGASDTPSPSGAEGPRFRLVLLGGLALRRSDGSEEPSLGVRGRKLVLLAYLALARRPVARDRLATFLWGDRDDERARHSLRDALSALRQVLGPAIPSRTEAVALAPGAPIDVDVIELRAAARTGDHARIIELYRGPFLDGVHVGDAPEVEDWIAEERRATERLFLAAAAAECPRLAAALRWDECAALARRWLDTDPADGPALVWRLRGLAAPSTPSALRGALAEYQRHAALLAHELDEVPEPAAQSFVAELSVRLTEAVRTVVAPTIEQLAPTVETPPPDLPPAAAAATGRIERRWILAPRPMLAAAVACTFVLLALALAFVRRDSVGVEPAELVIAGIESPSGAPADAWLVDGLPRLLTSSLLRERVPGVVDPSRVRAVARRAGIGDSLGSADGAAALLVARRMHAATLVSGEVTHGGGRFLLDLSVRDVASGSVRHRLTVSDTGLFGLVDRATARLLAEVDRPATGFRFEEVETSSVDAYRAYVRALDRLDAGRIAEASQLLDVAIAADSNFAAALETRLENLPSFSRSGQDSLRRLTAALAAQRRSGSDFDRRAAAVSKMSKQGDPVRAEQLAREVVARYPRDPRAYVQLVSVLTLQGSFAAAQEVATRSLALDSTAGRGQRPCTTCSMYGTLVSTALAAGDAPRAYAAARRAVDLNPSEPAPWGWLARALLARAQPKQAVAAARRAFQLAPREDSAIEGFGWLLIETGQLDAADSLIAAWSGEGGKLASAALDLRSAVLRERGQYRAAARTYATALAQARGIGEATAVRLPYASSLARAGERAAAWRVFEQAGHVAHGAGAGTLIISQTDEARTFAWPHALLADALFLSGSRDTLQLLALADSIETIGHRGAFGRDWRLPFHVRGLVAEIGGRWAEAERLFERARWGRGGWTRTNVELARTQLAQGRARDAIVSLRDARYGTLDGMGRYAPSTEIDAEIAETFLAARMPDSARVYLMRLRAAWAEADPVGRRRLDALERALGVGSLAVDGHPPVERSIATRGSAPALRR